MKIPCMFLTAVLVFTSATLLAQTTAGQAGSTTANPHSQHRPSSAASAPSGTQASGGMQMGNRQAGMAAMQADIQQMRTQVEQMRTAAQKVQDPNTRSALLGNVAMWEQFLNRMQSHMQMMGQGMMGMHGMMGQDMNNGCQPASSGGGCQMMGGQTPGTNANPPPPPK